MSLQALTLAQPWPSAMLLSDCPKRIENRDWLPPRKLLGEYVALHGGRLPKSKAEFAEARAALEWVDQYVFQDESGDPWDDDSILKVCVQGIYAVARVSEVLPASDDPWFMGAFGWVLTDFVAIDPPVPCRGAQKLWDVPAEALALVRERWKIAHRRERTPMRTPLLQQPAPVAQSTDLPPDPTPEPEPEAETKKTPKELLTNQQQDDIRALLCSPGPHRHSCDWVRAGREAALSGKPARELLDDLQWVSRHHTAWLESVNPALLALARSLPSDPYLSIPEKGVPA